MGICKIFQFERTQQGMGSNGIQMEQFNMSSVNVCAHKCRVLLACYAFSYSQMANHCIMHYLDEQDINVIYDINYYFYVIN